MQNPMLPAAVITRRHGQRVLFGLAVICAGLLALIDSLQPLVMPALRTLWPLALVLFGIARFVRPLHAASWVSGLVMVLVGLALTGQNLGLFHLSMRQWGPVLMVLGGLVVLLRGLFPRTRN